MGTVLHPIFKSSVFDVEDVFSFVDNNFKPRCDRSLHLLVDVVEKALETTTKWMRKSGLKVNEAKTEACLFYKRDCMPARIKLGADVITP